MILRMTSRALWLLTFILAVSFDVSATPPPVSSTPTVPSDAAAAPGNAAPAPPGHPIPAANSGRANRPSKQVLNGITVSEPKIFEERSLRLMLQAAEQRLAALGPIDQASLVARIGAIQGQSERFSDVSFSATVLPTPQVVTEQTRIESATPSTTDKTTTTQNAVIPQTPAATTFPTGFGPSQGLQPTIGLSARDTLAEQLALTFQIANLRLALERAVSDRYIDDITRDGRTVSLPRQPILLGFQVSLDSLSEYRGAVAEMRVTLSLPQDRMLSLLTLLPTKDTYNVSAITRKSSSIGAAAIAGVFQTGVGLRRGRGTYFLVQDSDTVGLQFPNGDSKSLTFGWQFRPVLGRKAVDSGMRQVFALVTLPHDSFFQNKNLQELSITATVETQWRAWDSRRQTLGRVIRFSRDERSLILNPAMFMNLQSKLAPRITKADWVDLGADRALVTVEGSNFFSDAQVAVGDTLLDRTNGLQIPDERRLIFTTSLKTLAISREASIIGRYSGRTEIISLGESGGQATVTVKSLEYVTPEVIRIKLNASHFGVNTKPIVVIGDTVFGGRERPLGITRAANRHISGFELDAPVSIVRTAQRFVARTLFGGDSMYAEFRPDLRDDFTAEKVITLAKSDAGPLLGIVGSNFDNRMVIEIAGAEVATKLVGASPSRLVTIAPTWNQIRGVEQIVVRKGTAPTPAVVLPLTPAPEVKKPKLPEDQKVPQGFSNILKLTGENLSSIKSMVFEGKEVTFELTDKGTAVAISLTTHVTGIPGPKTIELKLIDGSIVRLPLEVTKL